MPRCGHAWQEEDGMDGSAAGIAPSVVPALDGDPAARRRLRRRPAWRGVPATGDFEVTLWALLALAGAQVLLAALVGAGVVAVALCVGGALTMLVAAAVVWTIRELLPSVLRSGRRPVRAAVV